MYDNGNGNVDDTHLGKVEGTPAITLFAGFDKKKFQGK